jgi:hypothetical protein
MKTSRALAVLALALAACSPLAPRPNPSRFFLLSALATADGAGPALGGVTVGVGPVVLPAYLQRPQIATRVGPNQVAYAEYTRWAQPLETGMSRVLVQDLTLLLDPAQVVAFPWIGPPVPTYAVEIEVRQFEQGSDGTATLIARWSLRDGQTKALLAVQETTASEAGSGGDPAMAVAALSRMLATLSREIADGVRRAHDRS